MPETAKLIGAFIRWIFKGFKTNLKDEIDGGLEPKWLFSYDIENLLIGYLTAIIIIGIIIYVFF